MKLLWIRFLAKCGHTRSRRRLAALKSWQKRKNAPSALVAATLKYRAPEAAANIMQNNPMLRAFSAPAVPTTERKQ